MGRSQIMIRTNDQDTMSDAVPLAQDRGFYGLALDGFDLRKALRDETDADLLTQAFEIAQRLFETNWAEAFARRIVELDGGTASRQRLASVLASAGKCDEAQALTIPSDADDELGRITIAVLYAKAGRVDEAFEIFDRLPGRNDFHPAAIVLSVAQEIVEQSHVAHALAILNRLAKTYPAHVLIRSLLLRCYIYAGDLERVQELSQLPAESLKRAHVFERRTFVDAVAESFAHYGWKNQLFDFARDEIEKDPTHWKLYFRASVAASESAREKEFSQLVMKIPQSAHDKADALAVICRWHIDEERREECLPFLDKIRALSASIFLDTRLYLALYSGDSRQVGLAFDAFEACGLSSFGPTIADGLHAYYYDCSAPRLRDCVNRLERLNGGASKNAHYWQVYLRCLLALGEENRAQTIYEALPAGLASGEALGPFKMFFDAVHGRHDAAKDGWIRYIRATRHPSVNARSSYPKTVRLNYTETPGAVLLFTTLINAGEYLDWFLSHYRALGVDHFFVVDNGSTDGSFERLSSEPDVSLFSNKDSFATAGFGVLWINHLMQQFGCGHWCLHVDSDEALVFPLCHTGRTLKDVLSYCDAHGFGAMPAIELDMYPERLTVDPDADPFVASCYFDIDYTMVKSELPPYTMAQGGIRKRLIGLASSMQKTPLVRMATDVRYVNCNHGTTHLAMADISGALLHYKFIGDSVARFEKAVTRGEHYAGAISYRRLRSAVGSTDQARNLLSAESRRYDGPATLEDCGLIKGSAAWAAFSNGSATSTNPES